METAVQGLGLLIPFVFGLLYLAFLGFMLWVLLSVVESLRQMAAAQAATAIAMGRIADGMDKRT